MTNVVGTDCKSALSGYRVQDNKVREKIAYVFRVINSIQNIPAKFLKHLEGTDGLYEI